MLSEPSIISKTEINQKTDPSRFEELMTNYEDPVRATVHRLLEEYVEKAFIEFMEGRTGAVIRRSTDGKPIKDYRNGYRDIKQVPIDTMLLQGFRVPRNRVGGLPVGYPASHEASRREAGLIGIRALCSWNGDAQGA